MKKTELTGQYLDLLKKSLLNELYVENEARLIHTFISMLNNRPLDYKDYFNITRVNSGLIDNLLNFKLIGDVIVLRHTAADGSVTDVHDLRNVTDFSVTASRNLADTRREAAAPREKL